MSVFFFRCHLTASVTKRRKAHLKRLDRRWTLGGIVNRQQSRGENARKLACLGGCDRMQTCVTNLHDAFVCLYGVTLL